MSTSERSIYGLSIVLPGDLVHVSDDNGASFYTGTVKARYLGTDVATRPAGEYPFALVRVTGKSLQFERNADAVVPLSSVRRRDSCMGASAAYPTGAECERDRFHYGQLVRYRAGWYRVISSGTSLVMLAHPMANPGRVVRIRYDAPVEFLTADDVMSRIKVLASGSLMRTMLCDSCRLSAVKADMAAVTRSDGVTALWCPFCVAITDMSGYAYTDDDGYVAIDPRSLPGHETSSAGAWEWRMDAPGGIGYRLRSLPHMDHVNVASRDSSACYTSSHGPIPTDGSWPGFLLAVRTLARTIGAA